MIISGPIIADYAVWALLIVERPYGYLQLLMFVSFRSLVNSCLIGSHTTSFFIIIMIVLIPLNIFVNITEL